MSTSFMYSQYNVCAFTSGTADSLVTSGSQAPDIFRGMPKHGVEEGRLASGLDTEKPGHLITISKLFVSLRLKKHQKSFKDVIRLPFSQNPSDRGLS